MTKLIGYFVLTILFAIVCISCKTENARYIPIKDSNLSQAQYDKFIGLLEKAYDDSLKFKAAFQLSNLKADKKITYQLLTTSIKEDLSNCDQIFKWYYLYDRHNFGMNIVKYDTLLFKKTVKLCDELREESSYEKYAIMKDEEEKEAEANKIIEDSTSFNLDLVKELEQINFEDQKIRNRMSSKTITPELKKSLVKEMQLIDSLNLIKIDKILLDYGYPSRELVGKECNFTPALVIHHSIDLEVRYKYLPLLEEAVKKGSLYEGTLDMIKKRIKDMELQK